ncbi:MAG: YaiI/YqxD family protein [Alphaproteobacteria bacterium]|nr:YaiI/YqxD family protein [Alphaproteobacteria bacterium]
MLNIYVDADACPVKEEVIRVAERHKLEVYMVSNGSLRAAVGPKIHRIMVGMEADAADNWIAGRAGEGDIVITADIPLAKRALEKKAAVLGPNGKPFTPESIGQALAMRELHSYLREAGEIAGYNKSFSKQDRSRFLQSLEEAIQRIRRERE